MYNGIGFEHGSMSLQVLLMGVGDSFHTVGWDILRSVSFLPGSGFGTACICLFKSSWWSQTCEGSMLHTQLDMARDHVLLTERECACHTSDSDNRDKLMCVLFLVGPGYGTVV